MSYTYHYVDDHSELVGPFIGAMRNGKEWDSIKGEARLCQAWIDCTSMSEAMQGQRSTLPGPWDIQLVFDYKGSCVADDWMIEIRFHIPEIGLRVTGVFRLTQVDVMPSGILSSGTRVTARPQNKPVFHYDKGYRRLFPAAEWTRRPRTGRRLSCGVLE